MTANQKNSSGLTPRTAIGLMSGTSMDGADAAVVETDGYQVSSTGKSVFVPYSPGFRQSFRELERHDPAKHPDFDHLIGELTAFHADAVETLLEKSHLDRGQVDIIGFHGQTVYHAPDQGITIQLGDGKDLARRTRIPVVSDFRSQDIRHGGQGAPLAPLYHQALAAELEKPLAVLNLGGVANVTWIGAENDDVLAFDTGPGNALMDDWMVERYGKAFDASGERAARGHVSQRALSELLDNTYFDQAPPKSLDRRDFKLPDLSDLDAETGVATLNAFTVEAIVRSQSHMPERPKRWLVCGGGRHNTVLMEGLRAALSVAVEPVEAEGWDGDFLEAQAFAFLSVRALEGLPLSLPSTTGVREPLSGGQLNQPD